MSLQLSEPNRICLLSSLLLYKNTEATNNNRRFLDFIKRFDLRTNTKIEKKAPRGEGTIKHVLYSVIFEFVSALKKKRNSAA